ncbi:MAG: hypothetical protein HY044_04310 [Candidatus Woesebacteria bacterium]|nr:MAG: hypothetical protein HY044_04310 [Candidatus Woesebacteria bacterium]
MTISKRMFIALILFVIASTIAYKLRIQNSIVKSEPKTELLNFTPTDLPEKKVFGSCWVNSLASSNPKAWRCTVDHGIYDPCFDIEGIVVVCGVKPGSENKDSFIINLTKPLPTNEQNNDWHPWIMELSNGLRCTKITWAADSLDGEYYFYICDKDEAVVLGNIDTSNPLWEVKVGYRGTTKTDQYDVIKAWR